MDALNTLDLAVYTLALPIAIGIVELLKQAILPARWAGIAALIVGIVSGITIRLCGIGDGALPLAALTGAVAGLSAAGVWSGTKAAMDNGDGRATRSS